MAAAPRERTLVPCNKRHVYGDPSFADRLTQREQRVLSYVTTLRDGETNRHRIASFVHSQASKPFVEKSRRRLPKSLAAAIATVGLLSFGQRGFSEAATQELPQTPARIPITGTPTPLPENQQINDRRVHAFATALGRRADRQKVREVQQFLSWRLSQNEAVKINTSIRTQSEKQADIAASTVSEFAGVTYDIDQSVSHTDGALSIYGTFLTEMFLMNNLPSEAQKMPTGVTVQVRAGSGGDVSAATSTMDRVAINTNSSQWQRLSHLDRMELVGREFYKVFERQLSHATDGTIPGPLWLSEGSAAWVTSNAILRGLNPALTEDIIAYYQLFRALEGPPPPTLVLLEQSAPWQGAPASYYRDSALASFVLTLFGQPTLTDVQKLTQFSRLSGVMPWQDALRSVFGIDSITFYQVYAQVEELLQSPNVTPTPTATPTREATATRSPTPPPSPSSTPSREATPSPTRTPETQFYTQRRSIDGVEIRASAAVDARALQLAENNLRLLTNFEPASRSRMVANQFGGYAIIGRNQKLTDLPEFVHLRGQYINPDEPDPARRRLYDDLRGAFAAWPGGTTAIAEEILLDNPPFVCHEQSHPRHIFGFTDEQKQAWTRIFTNAKNRGIFPGAYGMKSEGEYWAEISRLWCGDSPGFTLDQLRREDPDAYDFVERRYGPPFQTTQTASMRIDHVFLHELDFAPNISKTTIVFPLPANELGRREVDLVNLAKVNGSLRPIARRAIVMG